MAMGGYNWNQMYDVAGAAAGLDVAMTPEERQMKKLTQMIKSAEATNYDGDPEYYQQIKTLAMQAGIPIKEFKTSAFRMAKAGLLSFADMALLGLVPNDWYTPLNSEEQFMSGLGTAAGLIAPWSGAGALARGAMGGLRAMPRWARGLANKGLGQSAYRRASQAYTGPMGWMGGRPGATFMAGGPNQAAKEAVTKAKSGVVGTLPKPKQLPAAKQPKRIAAAPKPKLLPAPKHKAKAIAEKYNKKIKNKKGAKMLTPTAVKQGRGPITPPNSKKIGIPAETNKKTLAAMKGKGTGSITVKKTGTSKTNFKFNKADERRIAAMMSPKVRRRYLNIKNSGKRTIFARTWAKKNPSKVTFT